MVVSGLYLIVGIYISKYLDNFIMSSITYLQKISFIRITIIVAVALYKFNDDLTKEILSWNDV